MKHTFYTLHTIIPDFGDVRKLTGYSPFTTKIDLYNEKVQLFMDASGEESKYYYFSELEIDDENQDNLAEIEDVALNEKSNPPAMLGRIE